jgi:LysR family transcriptional regulator, glycine cleavage system transcriptional activator
MPVRPPSLRSIAAFEAASRHQSFTRAAEELNLTTGAVSHAIKGLESRLDRQLFDRAGRRVSLTSDGQALATRVRLSLSLLAEAFDVSPWVRRDRLVVSALPSVAERILLPKLPDVRAALPEIAIDLRCSPLLADLDEVDVAIRFGPGGWSALQSRHLGGERLFPVASPSRLGSALPDDPRQLGEHQLIHHPDSHWRLWLEPLGLDVRDFSSWLTLDDSALVLEAAAQGMGVALARSRLASKDLRSGRLVRLFTQEVEAEYGYWAVWSASSPRRASIELFVDWAAQAFAEVEFPSHSN